MFQQDLAEGYITHLNNGNKYYGMNQGKILLEELHKLWKHHVAHLRELHQRKEYTDQQINKNSIKFKIGQTVMVKNYTLHTYEPKYLLDYKVWK